MGIHLVEGEDYYYNSEGLLVLTEKYLRERGHCCKNGCRHCPYGYRKEEEERKNRTFKR